MEITIELRKFVAPEIVTGVDARLMIGQYLRNFTSQKPMIVTDKILIQFQWFQEIMDKIRESVDEYVIYTKVTPNPNDDEVMEGARIFRESKCDFLISIGGGSATDCAKGIGIVAINGRNILDYEGVDEIDLPGPPLICIPTTAGASADVSQFCIIRDSDQRLKKAIISKKMVPELSLLDPVPLMTMNPYLTACTGMDALTHAIEAYVSNASSNMTDMYAMEAIKIIDSNIEKAVKLKERDIPTMVQMMHASLYAGLAFSNASLGAVHAMSHSLGGLLNLPHGECNSILLEHVIKRNFESSEKKYMEIARTMKVDSASLSSEGIKISLLSRIRELREKIEIPEMIQVQGLGEAIIDKLIFDAMQDPCLVTNPKEFSEEEMRKVYGEILREKS